ncbi:MAG: SH3 domain-containing protein [Burkholderiales bacterium]|nr:SH3 domain-containing protein [Burkholderiales bacterium]MDR4517997.1 SH3 domain-containing protein [Nitrosomonas sp.]
MTSVFLSGCVTMEESPAIEPIQDVDKIPIYIHQQQIESMQRKIEQLEQQLVEQSALIKQKRVREQDQAQLIQATSKEIAHTQVKLHRLATKPSSASLISEAEVALAYNEQQSTLPADQELHAQAQRLLAMAVTNYQRDDYPTATYYASQALEFINMISDSEREQPNRTTIRFNTPIMLQTTTDANLRREPGRHSLIIDLLQKGTVLTANAYQGNWLMVQTDKNTQGWVFNSLIEILEVDRP